MAKTKQKQPKPIKTDPKLVQFEDEEFDDTWGEKKPPVDIEKANKLKNMFFLFLLDISWKLAVSFLTPFFIALVLADGNKTKILIGIVAGLILSVVTIIYEVKRINKVVNSV